MDAWQFYPTPKALAERAWALFKNRSFTQTEQAFLNYVRNRSGEKTKQNKNNKKPLKEE